MGKFETAAYGFALGGMLGGTIGLVGGTTLEDWSADADGRIHEVQVYNEQLYDELVEKGFGPVERLILDNEILDDSERNDYSFETQDEQGDQQKCRGEYDVKNGIASLSGKVACTESMQVG